MIALLLGFGFLLSRSDMPSRIRCLTSILAGSVASNPTSRSSSTSVPSFPVGALDGWVPYNFITV